MVSRSGRITLCANDKFEVGSKFQWQYVLTRVDVKSQSLAIFDQGELVKSVDYPIRGLFSLDPLSGEWRKVIAGQN